MSLSPAGAGPCAARRPPPALPAAAGAPHRRSPARAGSGRESTPAAGLHTTCAKPCSGSRSIFSTTVGDRQSRRTEGAVDARGDQAVALLDLGDRRHEAQLEHAGCVTAAELATARRPFLTTCTGVAWSRSVISVTSEKQRMHARHLADDARLVGHRAAGAAHPASAPRSMKIFCEYGSRPAYSTSAAVAAP